VIILAVMLDFLPDPRNWSSIDAYPCVMLFFSSACNPLARGGNW
jgi:hypothetical protein